MPGLQFCWSFFRTKILFLWSNVSQQPRQVHQRALRALQDWSGPYAAILSDNSNMVYKLIIPDVKQFYSLINLGLKLVCLKLFQGNCK